MGFELSGLQKAVKVLASNSSALDMDDGTRFVTEDFYFLVE
jgi:hypothetical protein